MISDSILKNLVLFLDVSLRVENVMVHFDLIFVLAYT